MAVNGIKQATDKASPKVIILMCHPRSTSTMFERAFLNRKEFEVLHEPMGDPWYFGPQRTSPRFNNDECSLSQFKTTTYSQTWDDITASSFGKEKQGVSRRFVKDMAQYYLPAPAATATTPSLPQSGNPTFFTTDQLFSPHVIYTFLIRSPEKAVPSYYRLCNGDQCDITGFKYFDSNEVGLKELRTLYEFIVNEQKQRGVVTTPIIIDSEDLIKNPKGFMKFYCETVGVEWREEMLEWKADSNIQHFDKWKGWHNDAQNSTGINNHRKSTSELQTEWPKEVTDAIEANQADYRWLWERRVTL